MELKRRLDELADLHGGDPSLAYEAARMALDRASELYKQGPPYTLDGLERAREELPLPPSEATAFLVRLRATLSPAPPSQCTCGDGHPYQYDCPTHPASPPSEAQGLSPGVTLAQAIPADEAADEMLGELFRKHAPSGGVDWEPCQHDDGALCVETCLPPAPPARAEGGCEVNCPCHMYGGTYSPTHCGACG